MLPIQLHTDLRRSVQYCCVEGKVREGWVCFKGISCC
uniref:Uncharacterized protein n=1 Tax=Ciona intestinalis TaxID=7719 RepID=H2XQ51_CIOIN